MSTKTMPFFKNLIIMENFFGVSRPHLIEDQRTRLICDVISISVIITITGIIIMNLITVNLSIGSRILEFILCFEFYGIVGGSRFRKEVFYAIERLDEKCGVDDEFGTKIRAKTTEIIIVLLASFFVDIIGQKFLGVNVDFAIFLSVAFTAHDAEMAFASLMIETINMRLEKLKDALPNTGSRVYRHILIATAHISEQYSPRLLMMLALTLITTIAYEFILVLADAERIIHLSIYLIWRELRSLYSLYMMCSATARTGNICSELSLCLAGRLTQDQSISKEKNRSQYKTVKRWYSIVISQRPQYVSGSILSISLGTPILLLDLSINYMLIMVQVNMPYLTPNLTFREHIVKICKKAYINLGFVLRQPQGFTNITTLKVLYDALVRSHLEHSVVIWAQHEAKYNLMLERVQNFTRLLYSKMYGVYPFYPIMYSTLFVMGMVGYNELRVRRDFALAAYLVKLLRIVADNPGVLRHRKLSVPDRYVRRWRRPPLLALRSQNQPSGENIVDQNNPSSERTS